MPVFEQRPEHHDGCPFLLLSILFPQDRVSYSIWNSLFSVSLADQHVPEMYPPSSPHWGYRWPHVGAGDLNPGSHAVCIKYSQPPNHLSGLLPSFLKLTLKINRVTTPGHFR